MKGGAHTPPDLARRGAEAVSSAGEAATKALLAVGRLRVLEVIVGFGLIFEIAVPGLPVAIPVSQVVLTAAIVLAISRQPDLSLGNSQWVVPVLVLGLVYVGVLSMFADPSEFASDLTRRLIRLALTMVFLVVVASGRLQLRSVIAGFGIGLAVNAAAFYAGLAPDTYDGVLSGFFSDKNVAGLGYAVGGILLTYLFTRPSSRCAVYAAVLIPVLLTESRTAISAYLAAGAWLVLAPRFGAIGRVVLVALTALAVRTASEDYSQVGIFSDRVGSDLLRARIDAASELKVDRAGFWGSGLGEAYVQFDGEDRAWYFHNSYWSALVEGGWPWLGVLMVVTVLFAARPLRRVLSSDQVVAQAAVICVLVCAWRLGEVLGTSTWALAVAFGLAAFASRPRERPGDERGVAHQGAADAVGSVPCSEATRDV